MCHRQSISTVFAVSSSSESVRLLPTRLGVAFLQWVNAGGVTIYEMPPDSIATISARVAKYADNTMSSACTFRFPLRSKPTLRRQWLGKDPAGSSFGRAAGL